VVGVIAWVGALILLTRLMSVERLSSSLMNQASRIIDAGIGLAWLTGIVLVVLGGWYGSSWWQVKIVFVIIISAIHTITLSRWKRLGSDAPLVNQAIPLVLLCLTVVVVVLVILKRPV